jgi:hypothetical protein
VLLQIIECLLLGLAPQIFFLTTTPVHLAEGPCNMGESQHEPAVEIGKAPHEFVKEVVDLGNWVPDFDCDFIHGPIINVESPGSIFILYQHDWASTR